MTVWMFSREIVTSRELRLMDYSIFIFTGIKSFFQDYILGIKSFFQFNLKERSRITFVKWKHTYIHICLNDSGNDVERERER